MDFLDFIRKVAQERREGYIIKGGKGSGWYGPPKGTHVEQGKMEKPSWAGGDGVKIEEFDVYPGKYAAKDKWAVDENGKPSQWASTPEQAVKEHKKWEDKQKRAREESAKYREDVGRAKTGDKESFCRVAGSMTTISSRSAIDTLKELGVRDKDAKAIVQRMGIYGESSLGTVYRSVDELYKRYIRIIGSK